MTPFEMANEISQNSVQLWGLRIIMGVETNKMQQNFVRIWWDIVLEI